MFGHFEIAIIIVIILLIFGPMMIPMLGRQIGELWKATRDMKDSLPKMDELKGDKPPETKKDE